MVESNRHSIRGRCTHFVSHRIAVLVVISTLTMFISNGCTREDNPSQQAKLPEETRKALFNVMATLRGCPETSQPRCAAFKPLADDIGKQDRIAGKACSA